MYPKTFICTQNITDNLHMSEIWQDTGHSNHGYVVCPSIKSMILSYWVGQNVQYHIHVMNYFVVFGEK